MFIDGFNSSMILFTIRIYYYTSTLILEETLGNLHVACVQQEFNEAQLSPDGESPTENLYLE